MYPNHVLATTEKSCSKKKRAFAQIIKGENVILGDFWGKTHFLAKNRNFGPKKKEPLFNPNHVLATTEKSCSKKKVAFAQIIKGENVILGDFLG